MNNIVILGKEIPLYGVFCYLGITVAALAGLLICSKRKFPKTELLNSCVYTLVGAFLGAKLLFLIVSLRTIIEYDIPVMAVIMGGFVFYGGLVGGFIGLCIYARQFKEDLVKYLDIYACVLPLGHAFGRVGCFFAGCCYGKPVEWGYAYTHAAGSTPLGVPLLPIQLIESACLILIFLMQIILLLRFPAKRLLNTFFYAFSYPVVRFVLEFFRGDAERGRFLLSTSQWVSLAVFVTASVLLIRKRSLIKRC